MAVYNISPLFQPQYVGNAAAALTFAPAGGTTVPAGFQYRIDVLRVTNITAAPVTLKVWRVPSGSTDDNTHIVVPVTVLVPVAVQTFPQFDVTALWGAVLSAGDAIWMLAGSASALVVQGDGVVGQI
jgi:hypothetical protein